MARAFSGNLDHTVGIMKAAIAHRGYSLVDIFQPCVSFNKINTFKWFKDNTYVLEDHDPADRTAAMELAMRTDRYPLGILYRQEGKPTFEDNLGIYGDETKPLFLKEGSQEALRAIVDSLS